jgi:putative DNA primase/helicase
LADAQLLEQEIRRFADVRLVVIDPITAFLKSTSVQRAAAARLQRLAENSGAAVVVISHLAKTASRSALTQVLGSLGLVAVARALHIVVQEKETDRRLFLPAENNFASTRAGLAFKIEPRTTSAGTQVSAVVWDGPVTVSADEALASASGARKLQPALTDATNFLRVLLGAGPVHAKKVRSEASDAGVSGASLRRAAENLGVKSRRIEGIAGKGRWMWGLPDGWAPDHGEARTLTDAHSVLSSAE